MKIKRAKVIALLLAMLMVLGSFSAVFAETQGTEAQTQATEETAPETTTPGSGSESATPAETTTPGSGTETATTGSGTETTTPETATPGSGTETATPDTTTPETGTQDGQSQPDPAPAEESGTADAVKVTVSYVFEDGSQAAEPVTGEYKAGDKILSPEVKGYTPDKDQVEVVAPADPAAEFEATVTYAAADVAVEISYLFKDGSQAADTVTGEYKFGEEIKSPKVKGYKADKTKITVDMPEEGKDKFEATVTYKAEATKAVTGLALYPSYESIILEWDKVSGAKNYQVYRSTKKDSGFKKIATVKSSKSTIRYTDKKANGTDAEFSRALKYYYKVYAVSYSGVKSKASKKVSGTCVRPMYESVTFKASATLTSHDGKNKTRTFYGGQTIVAQGFGGGKYKFWYKGNYFYANYVRVYHCNPVYQPNKNGIVGKATSYKGIWAKQNYASLKNKEDLTEYKGIRYYSRKSAEDFVNKSKKSSKSKYLIWVSTYTQHIYIFKGKKGNWKLVKDWECSTGSAGSPTPTGFDKKIVDKWYSHSGIKFWNPFQHINSIHGQRRSYRFGRPESNGCVRNYDENAKWIYYTCKKGTGLIVY